MSFLIPFYYQFTRRSWTRMLATANRSSVSICFSQKDRSIRNGVAKILLPEDSLPGSADGKFGLSCFVEVCVRSQKIWMPRSPAAWVGERRWSAGNALPQVGDFKFVWCVCLFVINKFFFFFFLFGIKQCGGRLRAALKACENVYSLEK